MSRALWALFSLKPCKAFRRALCKQPRLVKPCLNVDPCSLQLYQRQQFPINPLAVSPRKTGKPFPQRLHRHINNSLNVYLFLDSELQLGKSKEFNNECMKVQVKRAFKSYFLSPKSNNKNITKAGRPCIKFSLTSNKNLQWCFYPLFQNQRPFSGFFENLFFPTSNVWGRIVGLKK